MEKGKKRLDSVVLLCNSATKMSSDIRKAILREMDRLGMNTYQLSKLLTGKVPQRTVYAFVRGEKDTKTETASVIMKTLGLTITRTKRKARHGRRKGGAI